MATVLLPPPPLKIEVTLSEGCGIKSSFPLFCFRNFSIDNLTSTSHKPRAVKTFVVREKTTENNRRRPFLYFRRAFSKGESRIFHQITCHLIEERVFFFTNVTSCQNPQHRILHLLKNCNRRKFYDTCGEE